MYKLIVIKNFTSPLPHPLWRKTQILVAYNEQRLVINVVVDPLPGKPFWPYLLHLLFIMWQSKLLVINTFLLLVMRCSWACHHFDSTKHVGVMGLWLCYALRNIVRYCVHNSLKPYVGMCSYLVALLVQTCA